MMWAHLQSDRVSREGLWLIEFSAPSVVKSARSGAENVSGDEGGESAREVHDSAPGKVYHARAPERLLLVGAEEAVLAPDGVHDDGVHKAGEERGVEKVRRHLTALRESARDDGGGRGGKRKLKEPKGVVLHVHEEKVARADESGGPAEVVPAVRECVADGVEAQRSAARIEQVLEHGVLHVLNAHGARAEHGEPRLHEEHQRRRVDEEELVDADAGHFVVLVGRGGDALQHLVRVLQRAGGAHRFDAAFVCGCHRHQVL
mmetsp:Transcript_36214/g.55353  ORF Transcript_36214/g.55353 Transcript_36214/m.55353 type:complete len:260 (-) Transcript_36214:117-896(-)